MMTNEKLFSTLATSMRKRIALAAVVALTLGAICTPAHAAIFNNSSMVNGVLHKGVLQNGSLVNGLNTYGLSSIALPDGRCFIVR